MNQKITLRFVDHVLTFVVPKTEVAEIRHTFRRKWVYTFARADGDFLVNLDQALWMKISPGDDVEIERGMAEEGSHILFESFESLAPPSSFRAPSGGGKHGNL